MSPVRLCWQCDQPADGHTHRANPPFREVITRICRCGVIRDGNATGPDPLHIDCDIEPLVLNDPIPEEDIP
jgi:hypothetical protein